MGTLNFTKKSISTKAYSFDDVLLKPAHSCVLPKEALISTSIGQYSFAIPVISAAMDTVTDSRMAIAMALNGGLGVVHKNFSITDQVYHVKKVKSHQYAKIPDPETVSPDLSVKQLKQKIISTSITGFPVINAQGVLVGMCTQRDIRFCNDDIKLVKDIMSKSVVSLKNEISMEQARDFFSNYKFEKLPLVDEKNKLVALITSKDLLNSTNYPHASKDSQGRLLCAAAVGVGDVDGFTRAEELIQVGLDILVIDSAHGHSQQVLDTVTKVKNKYPEIFIMAGNVATAEGAKDLVAAGASAIKVGIGPGSICTTRIVTGVGCPQLSAILEVSNCIKEKYPNIALIADGGIRYSGDLVKAIAAGADMVMLGSLLAGTEQSPGDVVLHNGRSFKSYRGMGSVQAMKSSFNNRYNQASIANSKKLVPEGVEARVPYRGKVEDVIFQLIGGLKSGMGYLGCKNLKQLYQKSEFVEISPGGLNESHVHDVVISSHAPNYYGKKL